jgi:4-amino-4-deoxy-L-arabinose transferase-like glycosyltransferase
MKSTFKKIKDVLVRTNKAVLLFLLAFCIRIWYTTNRFWIAGDSPDYIDLTKNLHFFNAFAFSGGNQLIPNSNPGGELMFTAFRPVLYPLMAAVVWTGEQFPYNTVLTIQAVLGALTVVLIYIIARDFFGSSIAFVSSLLLTISPLIVIFTGTILTETLFIFLTVLGCYCLSKKKNIPSGVVFGLALLTRPIILPFLLFLMIISLFSTDRKKLFFNYSLILLTAILVALPWMIRNSLMFKRLVLTQSSGYGTNLLAGSMDIPTKKNSDAQEFWDSVFITPCKLIVPSVCKRPFDQLNEAEQDSERVKIALEIIKRNPFEWIKVRLKVYPKFFLIDDGNTVIAEESNLSISLAIKERAIGVLFIKFLLFFLSLILLIFSLAGLYSIKNRFFETSCIWAFPVFFALIHLPMSIEPRYFLPALPFYYILSTLGGFYLAGKVRSYLNKFSR